MQAKPVALITRSGDRVVFRSKLEARWACFFDLMGFEWKYEPFRYPLDAAGVTYTPDFRVEGIGIIEVKPTLDELEPSAVRIARYIAKTKERVYLFHDAAISVLHSDPMQVLPLNEMQRLIILGGTQRRQAAKEDYHLFHDAITAVLRSAFGGRLDTDALTISEQSALADTRDSKDPLVKTQVALRKVFKAGRAEFERRTGRKLYGVKA